MKIVDVPFSVTDWTAAPKAEHVGTRGTSFWKTAESGNVRTRIVEYSPGFVLDHYCPRGHVVYVLEGDILIRLTDGTEHALTAGMGFHCADDEKNQHHISSVSGAKVFIVD